MNYGLYQNSEKCCLQDKLMWISTPLNPQGEYKIMIQTPQIDFQFGVLFLNTIDTYYFFFTRKTLNRLSVKEHIRIRQ